ncbi:MAG: hypothetical protein AB8H80_00830 [Planctomycetota bacterium]
MNDTPAAKSAHDAAGQAPARRPIRSTAVLLGCSSTYGFSIGIANSDVYGLRNLVKFPLLIIATAAICALSYHVLSRFLGTSLNFVRVQSIVLGVFRDMSVLLASLTPVALYLAMTMVDPTPQDLGGYPMFLGFNTAAIATCGCLSVAYRARRDLPSSLLDGRRRALLLALWLCTSLGVGGQVCWSIRPFFGWTPGTWDKPWFAAESTNTNGARSFYEAIYHLLGGERRS